MDILTEAYESISLSCLAESFPYPTYQWQMMNRDSGSYDNLPGERGTVLSLSPVHYDDYGRYHCVATNVIDDTERTANSSSALVTGKLTTPTCCNDFLY